MKRKLWPIADGIVGFRVTVTRCDIRIDSIICVKKTNTNKYQNIFVYKRKGG